MKLSVTLNTGLSLRLQSLLVLDTYRGFLEGGYPLMNRILMGQLKQPEGKLQTGIPSWKGIPRWCLNTDSFETWTQTKFPDLQCCGEFRSYKPARDTSMDASTLIVVWFQNEMHPVISPENLLLLEQLDWKKHALDFEY